MPPEQGFDEVGRIKTDAATALMFDYGRLRFSARPAEQQAGGDLIRWAQDQKAQAAALARSQPGAPFQHSDFAECLLDAPAAFILAWNEPLSPTISPAEFASARDLVLSTLREVETGIKVEVQQRVAAAPTDLARRLAEQAAIDQGWMGMLAYSRWSHDDNELATAIYLRVVEVKKCDVERRNRALMSEIMDRVGWPTANAHGAEAASDAWLLVQHVDMDPAFQARALALLGAAVQRGEADKRDYAYLFDRVALGGGRPQRFGTQFWCRDGRMQLKPVEAPERLAQLRREYGLPEKMEYELSEKKCKGW
ncbi:DUF6624 domain-containing protein [Niveispirillum sp. BGYR6]|uniref:DUF6624 domain-containing protein n=1 Tax=Niveispirillum sp. BGYR6 TaxID=2971249 RepID=UPI0022B9B090|nr:DUF6624 domain-containing protein [Niveispirillum sp. BGYR6]MDG5494891.1 hypothetical protein [Niveispirillum sp. BGYR6]